MNQNEILFRKKEDLLFVYIIWRRERMSGTIIKHLEDTLTPAQNFNPGAGEGQMVHTSGIAQELTLKITKTDII